jgi:hypothetical protein
MSGGREEMSKHIHRNNPCVLIEGPNWGDAELDGKWLY